MANSITIPSMNGPLKTGDQVYLQTDDEKDPTRYLKRYNEHAIVAEQEFSQYSIFTVTVLDNSKITLQADTGEWLSQDGDGKIFLKDHWDQYCHFTVNPVDSSRITLQAYNKKYLRRHHPNRMILVANKDNFCQFTMTRHEAGDGIYVSVTQGQLADNGDLDQPKCKAWASAMPKDYYAHKFFKDTIPIAINPVDDREEGGKLSSYNTLRRLNPDFVKFSADTATWEADKLHVSDTFFKLLPTPEFATPQLYQDDLMFARFVTHGPDPT